MNVTTALRTDEAVTGTANYKRDFASALEAVADRLDMDGATVQQFMIYGRPSGKTTGFLEIPLTSPVIVREVLTDDYTSKAKTLGTIEVTAVMVKDPANPFTSHCGALSAPRFDQLYFIGRKMTGKPGAMRPHVRARAGEWQQVARDYSPCSTRTFTVMS